MTRRDSNANAAYGAMGDEVSSVLASAREAAAEMRIQARLYAESLVVAARQEIDEVNSRANEIARARVTGAEEEAKRIIVDAQRQVLRIVESAVERVEEAEASVNEALRRRSELMAAEAELASRLEQITLAVAQQIDGVRQSRGPAPVAAAESFQDDLAQLGSAGAAALLAVNGPQVDEERDNSLS